ncbi:LysR family transcriptional regulator [Massilia sp. P8910]|uniref:LysR family transcriptional regulator n=1 Tax=Massilia antarctica TaxID=2765360 RepID=UPI001E3E255F|nr:LysR family transcriptional regulator [Massilia antarctica]MCE3608103.1 LysR family transcriptional regulator [Massilia antarctica]
MDHLSGLAVFVRAAETRSYVGAARALGLSPSAIGKSIGRLEAKLGVRLFHRSTRSINLTEEGMQFFERCRQILEDLDDAQAALTKSIAAPRGRLRISVPAAGHRLLMPVLPSFRQAYPDVELDIDFSDRLVDVIDEGFDMVIRSGDLTDSRLYARRLCSFRFKLCGSPVYFAKNGMPMHPQDLPAHMCLRFKYPSSGKLQEWRLSEAGAELVELRVPTAMTLGSIEATLSAAIGGMGIAYLPDFVVEDAMNHQSLLTAVEEYNVVDGNFWMLWPSNRYVLPKLRVWIDHLSGTLGKRGEKAT